MDAVLFYLLLALPAIAGATGETQVRNAALATGLSVSSEKVIVTEKTWNNLTHVACAETGPSYVYMQPLQRSALLVVRGLGFSIPDNAAIDSVQVTWTVRITDPTSSTNRTHPHEVVLVEPVVSGPPPTRWPTPAGDNRLEGWNSTWSTKVFPLSGDDVMWGIGSSDALSSGSGVSNPLFGVAISVDNLNLATFYAEISCVKVEVSYTPPATTAAGSSTTGVSTGVSTTAIPVSTTSTSQTTSSNSGSTTTTTSTTVVPTTTSTTTTTTGVPATTNTPAITTGKASQKTSESNGKIKGDNSTALIIAFSALALLFCLVAISWSAARLMARRTKRAHAFMRGEGLPHLVKHSDSSSSDPGHALDGISDDSLFDDIWLDDITIGREIGRGNFGAVYLCKWHDETDVACKSLTDDSMNSSAMDEARQLSRLNHPNIVRFFGLHRTEKDELFIVMEYLPRGSLDGFLKSKEGRQLAREELLRICIDTTTGMHYLANKNVIHGDLGARNLLVEQYNDHLGVKIADFGLSLICDRGVDTKGEQYCRIPNGKSRKIPVKYSALEVIFEARYSIKSDVWSFGVVLWELFSQGQKPFQGLSGAETVQHLRTGNRMERPQACTENVYDIMLRCWDMDPASRPSFSKLRKEFREELRRSNRRQHDGVSELSDDEESDDNSTIVYQTDMPGIVYQTDL